MEAIPRRYGVDMIYEAFRTACEKDLDDREYLIREFKEHLEQIGSEPEDEQELVEWFYDWLNEFQMLSNMDEVYMEVKDDLWSLNLDNCDLSGLAEMYHDVLTTVFTEDYVNQKTFDEELAEAFGLPKEEEDEE